MNCTLKAGAEREKKCIVSRAFTVIFSKNIPPFKVIQSSWNACYLLHCLETTTSVYKKPAAGQPKYSSTAVTLHYSTRSSR